MLDMEPGKKPHNLIDLITCQAHIHEAVKDIEADLRWADEILAACKSQFETSTINLLPKTPSQKKRPQRKARRRLTEELEASTESEEPAEQSDTPVRRTRSTRSRKAPAAKKTKKNASQEPEKTVTISLPAVNECCESSSTPAASVSNTAESASETDEAIQAGVRDRARAYETMLAQRIQGSPATPKSTGKCTLKSTGKDTPRSTGENTPKSAGKPTPKSTDRRSSHTNGKTGVASHIEAEASQDDDDIVDTSQNTRRSSRVHEKPSFKHTSIKVLSSKARLRSMHGRLSMTGPCAAATMMQVVNDMDSCAQSASATEQHHYQIPQQEKEISEISKTAELQKEQTNDSEPKGRAPRTRLRLNKNKSATDTDSCENVSDDTADKTEEETAAMSVEEDKPSTSSTRTKRKKQKSSSDDDIPHTKMMKEAAIVDDESEVRTRTRTKVRNVEKAAPETSKNEQVPSSTPEPSKKESLSPSEDQAMEESTATSVCEAASSSPEEGHKRPRTRARKVVEAKDIPSSEESVFEEPAAVIREEENQAKTSCRGDSGIGKSTSDNGYELASSTPSSKPAVVALSKETISESPKVRRETRVISKAAEESEEEPHHHHHQEQEQEEERPARSTRTKTRQAQDKGREQDNADTAHHHQAEESRTTRTKTRKRKAEEEAADQSLSKKSHTETPPKADHHMDEDNNQVHGSDNDSDYEDIDDDPAPSTKRPVPSFLNQLRKSSLNNSTNRVSGVVTSFLKRNTPPRKPTFKHLQEQKVKELAQKEKRDQERINKLETIRKNRAEEQKKKREERMKRVAEMREIRQKKEEKLKQTLAEKMQERLNSTEKLKVDKYKEEREKQRMRLKRQLEADERRRLEEEQRQKKIFEQQEEQRRIEEAAQRKREQEEQERMRRQLEERRRLEERAAEAERRRQADLEKLRQQEIEREREKQKEREQREKVAAQQRAERMRQELEKKKEREQKIQKEMEKLRELELQRQAKMAAKDEEKRREEAKLQKIIDEHNRNLQNLGITSTLTLTSSNNAMANTNANASAIKPLLPTKHQPNPDSYPISPVRKKKNGSIENYNINDLKSDDSTDDDENPRKRIPPWAQGANLKAMLINQEYNPPNLDAIFSFIEPPDLNSMFAAKRPRFNKRTSSAVWNSPMNKGHN